MDYDKYWNDLINRFYCQQTELERVANAFTGKWRDHWYSTGSVSDLSLDQ